MVVFLDAIHFKVKQNRAIVKKKAAYMVIGIVLDCKQGCAGHVDWRERNLQVLAQRAE
ncbi:hypothetical protein PUR_04870 [Paenibacillus sp. URB8-2]|nr:hypothetical protein PUR_04870 [Paenibacillus sp. URB8-2]